MSLENGLSVVTIEDHRAPLITIDIALPTGSSDDPAGHEGLAAATADLLQAGAAGLSSKELAQQVEQLGGQISTATFSDYTEISISVLAENGPRLLGIAAEILLKPDFPEDEVKLYKDNRVQTLAYQRQDPAFVAREYFNRALYGTHPYAVSAPTDKSIGSLSREDIERFYKTNYYPEGSVIAMVGDFEPAMVENAARSEFGSWRNRTPARINYPAPPTSTGQRIYLIDRPGSEQADIQIGNLAARRGVADFLPLAMANAILGGGLTSRLFLNVREQKGYAYDVSSSLDARIQHGTFYTSTETRNEVVVPAIREIIGEFERMRNTQVSAADLRSAKNYVNGIFALSLSTQGGLADRIISTQVFGLGADFIRTFRDRVSAVTAEQIQQAAQTYILPDRATIVVVGDAATLEKSLEALG
ncbi:MAG TPA: pitrilysin family protein, partial [Blastocatellia bacterium]